MNRKDQLNREISELESQLQPLKNELKEIYVNEQKEVEKNIELCHSGKHSFLDSDLIYSATAKCNCGAGLAYPKGVGIHGNWDCSGILTGRALTDLSIKHDAPYSFSFYEIKSEQQPSANGQTTRPKQ